jgi:hypothetical protein
MSASRIVPTWQDGECSGRSIKQSSLIRRARPLIEQVFAKLKASCAQPPTMLSRQPGNALGSRLN